MLRTLSLLFVSLLCLQSHAARVAIIIDDIGYRQTDRQSLNLPVTVTFSILPHTPLGKEIAQQASRQQREVMLHMPMETIVSHDLGPGTLTSDMGESDIIRALDQARANIPMAVGLNNHMGSKLTALQMPMQITMRWLQNQNMFFVDSRTTAASKAEVIARQTGLATIRRHVFLDNQLEPAALRQQINTLIKRALKHQVAVAIAHPHPETLLALQNIDQQLAAHGIELVPVSRLLDTPVNLQYQQLSP